MYINLVCSLILPRIVGIKPWLPIPRGNWWWTSAHNSFLENSKQNGSLIQVLFYGDSITSEWSTTGGYVFKTFYKPLGAYNYGISGDRVEHLLWRIIHGEVNNINPKVVVLMIGTNNVFTHSNNEISLGISSVVRELRTRLPTTKILLLGILPRSNQKVTERIIAINQLISQISEDNDNNHDHVHFLEMTSHFYTRRTGSLNKSEYHKDLLHLSRNGYQTWAQVMDQTFRHLMF